MRGAVPLHGIDRLLVDHGALPQLISCRPSEGRRPRLRRLLDVRVAPERLPGLLKALDGRSGRGVSATRTGPDRLFLFTEEPMPSACLAVFAAGGACRRCPFPPAEGEPATWDILVPHRQAGQELVRTFAAAPGPAPAVLRVRRPDPPGRGLTARQEEVLRRAFAMGYYDYPRRASLGDVARAVGGSRSAVLEVLRRGSGRLVGDRVRSGTPRGERTSGA